MTGISARQLVKLNRFTCQVTCCTVSTANDGSRPSISSGTRRQKLARTFGEQMSMEQQEIQTLRALMEYEAARTEPPEGFPHLPDMPCGSLHRPTILRARANAKSSRKSWLFAGHLDEIPEPGCYMKWEQAGEPVVLVHTEQGEVKAFYNVCSHRGAPVVTEPKRQATQVNLQVSWLELFPRRRTESHQRPGRFQRPRLQLPQPVGHSL